MNEAARNYYDSMRVDGKLARNGRPFVDGEWHAEPDRIEWQAHGFACIASRNRMGAWCGYVAMPPSHPWHGKHYDAPELYDVLVHGGLTYAEPCSDLVCHVPAPGEPDNVWWLGFDCAHSGDLIPSMLDIELSPLHAFATMFTPREIYRDAEYVKAETERLAAQAAAVKP